MRNTPEDLLASLVAFDTTSSNPNRACIDFIRDYLDGFGVKSDVLADSTGNKACLWATLGPGVKGGIVLAGHSDTVPVEGQNWTSDPFKLREKDGKLFARGACDMKGFIACALAMVPELVASERTTPIHLAITHDEETDMSGAQRLTEHMKTEGLNPEWVWIGEPTSLRIINSHKGIAGFSTDIRGVPGHSSEPDKGLNAITLGSEFMDMLNGIIRAKKEKPFKPSRFDPPYTTLNLGTAAAGTAFNVIAEHFNLGWEMRVHPGDDLMATLSTIEKEADQRFKERFQAFAPHAGIKTCTCFNIPPLMPTKDNPGETILGRLTGNAETEAVSFATEAGFFQSLGTHVVVCGPGDIAQAHKADEYVEKSQLFACIDLMRPVLLFSSASK